VRPRFSVLLPPRLDPCPRLGQALKPVHMEAFVAPLAVEALNQVVLYRPPRGDEVQLDATLVRPERQSSNSAAGSKVVHQGVPVPEASSAGLFAMEDTAGLELPPCR